MTFHVVHSPFGHADETATGWVGSSKLAVQRKAPHSRGAVGIRGAWIEGGGGTHIDPHGSQLASTRNVPLNYADAGREIR
jgi:hypothetical protein